MGRQPVYISAQKAAFGTGDLRRLGVIWKKPNGPYGSFSPSEESLQKFASLLSTNPQLQPGWSDSKPRALCRV
jgi:hypothetical protein